jgi:L,D-transpeptidase ErfK/SrfK
MARQVCLLFLGLLLWANASGAAPQPPLYHQVAGGQEDYEVTGPRDISRLAQQKGEYWEVLVRRNALKKPYRLKKGMVLKIDNTHIVPDEVSDGLVINLPELKLYYFVNGTYQRRYFLAVGKRSWPTPTGNFKIVEKRKNPTWNVPPSIQDEMEDQGLDVVEHVPPGPQNPLGAYFMATSAEGVGIHATNRPWSVGYSVSHGCIRMLPEEIAQLFPQIKVGTPVKIIYRPIKLALTPEGRIYLEANPNIYQRELHGLEYVQELAREYQLQDRVDWDKVRSILKAREGIAQDVTQEPPPPGVPGLTPPAPVNPREVKLSPLQEKEAKVE